MKLKPSGKDVKMRTADSSNEDFHILEELSKPNANLSAIKISVWIYYDRFRNNPFIREIILSGHAESQTCASVTSILIEGLKGMDEYVECMLTCGAAYFRMRRHPDDISANNGDSALNPENIDMLLISLNNSQNLLQEMIRNLRERAKETGLIEIFELDWEYLNSFRAKFYDHTNQKELSIYLPDIKQLPLIADYFPIYPYTGWQSQPLILKLEGWEYDDSEFETVADIHFQKVQQELLKDAKRRMRKYREWLREWVENWIQYLHFLSHEEADSLKLSVPTLLENGQIEMAQYPAIDFLTTKIFEFLDRGQTWVNDLYVRHTHTSFSGKTDEELDRPIKVERVVNIDFERGRVYEKNEETVFTWRNRIRENEPNLIATCLIYIRRMEHIIKPYQEMMYWRRGAVDPRSFDPQKRGVYIVEQLSKKIVLETMIRGWPSFYLQDKRDRATFDAWAQKNRQRIWNILANQMKKQGVDTEILREDNVVYEISFNNELGCEIKPLMLVDNTTYAEIHRSKVGAGAVIPLWSRHVSREMPQNIIESGADNSERASALLSTAKKITSDPDCDLNKAAEIVRAAIACHPGYAGYEILKEWATRLGRDTASEFRKAAFIIEAFEFLAQARHEEAEKCLKQYISLEEKPVLDFYIIRAINELWAPEPARAEYIKKFEKHTHILEALNKKSKKDLSRLSPEEFQDFVNSDPMISHMLENLKSTTVEIEELQKKFQSKEMQIKELVEKALQTPSDIKNDSPALYDAVQYARDLLSTCLNNGCRPMYSAEFVKRYSGARHLIQIRAVLQIIHNLSSLLYEINKPQLGIYNENIHIINSILASPWLIVQLKNDLEALREDYLKGEWDSIIINRNTYIIREAVSVCIQKIMDLIGTRNPFARSFREESLYKIHVKQTIEGEYNNALAALLENRVSFGRATSATWDIVNTDIESIPDNALLEFDEMLTGIKLVHNAKETVILKTGNLSAKEIMYIKEVIHDPEFPKILMPFPSLAESILAAEIVPCPDWRNWRDVMALLKQELIIILSSFRYKSNLLPEFAPPLSEEGLAYEARANYILPRDYPRVDWDWSDKGEWRRLVG